MKRKIFSKLLMGAILFASVSAFVSCKDYDDDINANKADIKAAQEQLATLSSSLTSLQQKLEAEKAALQKELADAKSSLETQIANAKAELNAAIAKKADQSTVDALVTRVANLETDLAATKEAFNARIDAINKSIESLEALIAKKADQTYVDQAIATLNAAISGKVSTEDFNAFKAEVAKIETNLSNLTTLVNTKADQATVEAAFAAVNKDIAQLQEKFEAALAQQKKDFDAAIAQIKTDMENGKEQVNKELATKADKAALDALTEKVNGLAEAVTALQAAVATKAEKAEVDALSKKLDEKVADLQNQINKLVTPEQLEAAVTKLENAIKALESATNAKIDLLESNTEKELQKKANQADFAELNADFQALKAAFERHNENIALMIYDAVTALDNKLTAIIDTKVDQDEFDETVEDIYGEIDDIKEAIADILKTLVAVNGELGNLDANIKAVAGKSKEVDSVLNSLITNNAIAIEALDIQVAAIEGFLADFLDEDGSSTLKDEFSKASQAVKDSLAKQNEYRAAAITEIGKVISALRTELQDSVDSNAASIADLQEKFKNIDAIISKSINANLNNLRVFIDRLLKSIVLRPDTYYGGIEGVSVYTYVLPEEKPNPCHKDLKYRYFERKGTLNISDYGEAQYHVNPSNVDLTNYSIDFYNWTANIKEPAADERITPTRSGVAGGITPVYKTTAELLKANPNNLKDGILTVPFTADAKAIEDRLAKGIGTIASLSLEKTGAADTTVNSDYAIVVPEYGYGLLIGDNTFPVATRHLDQIGYDGGEVNSSNLHRSFSFLALATTSPTHTIKYDGSFDITKVLESRYVPLVEDYIEEITDTVDLHAAHRATAQWSAQTGTWNIEEDGDASIDKAKVVTMTDATFKKLGFHYDIQLVNYTLGSNKTGETVHLELIEDENGHVIAYPRNVTADGKTITGKTANAACVGRQPIVCIMVKDSKDRIVSFAYMKFLITQDAPNAKDINFDIKDLWANCKPTAGRVTWSEVEYHILDSLLNGMSKQDFDKFYVFDYYADDWYYDDNNATWRNYNRYANQYDKNHKLVAPAATLGTVSEEWNESAQGVEDATTHIIKWAFTADELKTLAEALKNGGKLEDKGDFYANKEEIATWVRYAYREANTYAYAPAIGSTPTKGNPSIWMKLTIPVGEFHVAKGDMGANKILTYWYDLNSKTNATGTDDAFEVRINVPVPVPETSATLKTIGFDYDFVDPMDIRYDNLLEMAWDPIANRYNNRYTEFTKDLKDFFIDGKLSATVKKADKFSSIKGMKLGCEFILPSTTIGNATFNAGKNNGVENSWVVNGYTGTQYTLILSADHTKILIKAVGKKVLSNPLELITLNYDNNSTVDDRMVTVVNYVNGPEQDDILNYKTHNELGELETFTAYINIKAVNACAPVYWNNMWFNARFLRPLDLEEPKQAVVPDAPNDWHVIDLTDALIVKDWREYYGDRTNSTGGADVKRNIPGVGNVKAFDFAYYQVELDITENAYYTDANLGTSVRSDVFDLGKMPRISSVKDATDNKFIKTSSVPNLKLEKISNTKLRYLNNSGVTGGFHVFVPITMTYVYGFQTVRQTKWVTVGVTPSVEQAMIEGE